MDWTSFSLPFNIQSGWKNTWQALHFSIFFATTLFLVTCPQFSNVLRLEGMTNCISMPRRIQWWYIFNFKSFLKKSFKSMIWKEYVLKICQVSFQIENMENLISWDVFQTNFLTRFHCACHTSITIISGLSQVEKRWVNRKKAPAKNFVTPKQWKM